MPRRPALPPSRVREPVQVYLEADDSALLARLAATAGLSKAEVMRRGMRAFARESAMESPMLRFAAEGADGNWPAHAAADHDAILAAAHRGPDGRRR